MKKTVRILLGIILILFILMISSGFESFVTTNFNDIPFGLTSQIVILILSGLLIYFFKKKKHIDFTIGKIYLKQLITPIAITFFLSLLTKLIFKELSGNPNEEHFLSSMSVIQIFFMGIILAPISEELLFRGFLQNILSPIKNLGIRLLKIKLSLPVIISGVFFGLIHFGLLTTGSSFDFTLITVLAAVVLGTIAGYFQEKHQSFLLAVIIHITANVSGILLDLIIK